MERLSLRTRSRRSPRPTIRIVTRARRGRSTAGFQSVRRFRRLEGRLHGQLPGPPHRAATGLFELPHQRRCLYYACAGAGGWVTRKRRRNPTVCYPAVGNWNDHRRNTHQSHELRFSTSDDNRFACCSAVLGRLHHQRSDELQLFGHTAVRSGESCHGARRRPGCTSAVGPLPGTYATDPSLRTGSDTAFGEDVRRGYRQTRRSPRSISTSSEGPDPHRRDALLPLR